MTHPDYYLLVVTTERVRTLHKPSCYTGNRAKNKRREYLDHPVTFCAQHGWWPCGICLPDLLAAVFLDESLADLAGYSEEKFREYLEWTNRGYVTEEFVKQRTEEVKKIVTEQEALLERMLLSLRQRLSGDPEG